MSAGVRCDVEQVKTRTVVRLTGDLTLATEISVRLHLLTCLAEQPDALLVDLESLTVADPTALSVFTAAARQASLWPGTPMLLCAPDPTTAAKLASGAYGRLQLFDSIASALRAEPAGLLPSVSEVLLPVAGAARQARNIVTDACLRWELPDLVGPASVVATELVGNAVTHAGTIIDLRISLRRHLLLAVRDGSGELPRLALTPPRELTTGRGLLLVDAIARRWGSLPVEGGKVVWAAIDARPPA